MPTLKAFRLNQRGKEGTPGNAVAATARWIGEMTLKEANKVYLPDYPYGVLSAHYHPGIQVAKAAELSFATDLTFEQFIDFLAMGIAGGVSPSGGGADKTWAFSHDVDDDPAPDTFTVELGNDDGTTAYGREVEYVFCKRFGIAASIDEVMKFTADLVGRQVTDGAVTGAIGVPAVWEPALANKLIVAVNDTWATLGNTPLTAKVIDMSLDVTTGLREGKYLSGNLYFEKYLFGPLAVDLTMTLEFDATADAEQELVRDRSLRFVRLDVLGSALGGSNNEIKIDLACFHAEDSIQELFSDRDGNDTVRLHLLGCYDPTGAHDVEFTVVNSLAAIP